MAKPKIKHTITKKEWNKKHKDFKTTINGIPYIMMYDDKVGTYLAPVKIVDEGVDEAYSGNMRDFRYEFPQVFNDVTRNSEKAIKRIAKKGKGYEVRTSTYMSEPEMKAVGDAMGLKLVDYQKSSNIAITIYESVDESIKEAKRGEFEVGDFVHFKSANKTGLVRGIKGDKVTILTMKGNYTGDIKDVQVLYQDGVNEKMDMNDPILIKLRAAQMKKNKDAAKKIDTEKQNKNAIKIKALKKKRAQVMRDMEQEAEPEGGKIADRYGKLLNRIDNDIIKLGGNPMTEAKKFKQVKKDKYGNHLEPQFKKGDKVTYLGNKGVITGVNKEMGGVYSYNVSYDKGNSRTKASNIFNKSGNDLKIESVNEASDVEVYHKSYTHAIEAAKAYALKKGYEIEDDEMFTKVGMNSKRPSVGKTTRVSLELMKGGKPQRKMLHIQVYGMKNGYELNAYIN